MNCRYASLTGKSERLGVARRHVEAAEKMFASLGQSRYADYSSRLIDAIATCRRDIAKCTCEV